MRLAKFALACLSASLAVAALVLVALGRWRYAAGAGFALSVSALTLVGLFVRSATQGLRAELVTMRKLLYRDVAQQGALVKSVAARLEDVEAQLDVHTTDRAALAETLAESQRQVELVSYRQVEALLGLYQQLEPRVALPRLRGWAASPDLLAFVVAQVGERTPELVVECGSGSSTLVIAYALEQCGHGRVVALEHDPSFAEGTRRLLRAHGLDRRAQVVEAPLKSVNIGEGEWLWYDMSELAGLGECQMVLVDGPPAATQPLARYPALPLLNKMLSEDAILILDDCNRVEEQQIVERWLDEFDGWSHEYITEHEKVTGLLWRGPSVGIA